MKKANAATSFGNVVSKNAVAFSTKRMSFQFPAEHVVSGVVIPETASGFNYPTVVENFTGIQKFLKMSEEQILSTFHVMMKENEDLAIRFILWARDILKGAGLRDPSRKVFASLSNHPNIEGIINRIPTLGRFDDLLIEWKSERAMRFALNRYMKGFETPEEIGLAAKWAPRKNSVWAWRLRKELGLTPADYRKFLVRNTSVVETQMCANNWNNINYSHVPGKAHSNYRKAFVRHSPDRYANYVEQLKSPELVKSGVVKINAKALAPYELAAKVIPYDAQVIADSIDAQFQAMPYDMGDLKIFPIIDVSPSMKKLAMGQLTCKQIAVSLGLFISKNQVGDLNGKAMTFSETPCMVDFSDDGFSRAVTKLNNHDWGMYTDLTASMRILFNYCKNAGLKNEDLPDVMIIFSDMQMNGPSMSASSSGNKIQVNQIIEAGERAGYTKIPKIIFWNLSVNGKEVKVAPIDKNGVINISGFSPKILTSLSEILKGESMEVNTDIAIIETLCSERYNYM